SRWAVHRSACSSGVIATPRSARCRATASPRGAAEGPRRARSSEELRAADTTRARSAITGGAKRSTHSSATPAADATSDTQRARRAGVGRLLVGGRLGRLCLALLVLVDGGHEVLVDGEQVAAGARATADAQDQAVPIRGDTDEMKLLHAWVPGSTSPALPPP